MTFAQYAKMKIESMMAAVKHSHKGEKARRRKQIARGILKVG